LCPDSQFTYFNLCVTPRCDIPIQFLCSVVSKKYYQYILRFKFTLSFVLEEIKDNLRLLLFQIIIRICFYLLQVIGFDFSKCPNVSRWLEKAKKTFPKYEELNHAGCLKFKEMYESKFGKK